VIGVNTAIFSTSGGSQGVGFAIPINTAKQVINELIQYGMVMEPWVGIEYQELNKDIAAHFDSPVSEGLLISDVVEGGPAQKAGLVSGDIVVKIGDQSVRTLDEATAAGKLLKSGQEATFRVVRNRGFQDITVKVGSAETAGVAEAWFGIVVQVPTREAARKYRLSSHKRGVLVIQVDRNSPADVAELQRGDLILTMAKEQTDFFRNFDQEVEIKTIDDFRKFVSGIRRGQRIRIVFERRNKLWRTYLAAARS
jgi:serine protease Do